MLMRVTCSYWDWDQINQGSIRILSSSIMRWLYKICFLQLSPLGWAQGCTWVHCRILTQTSCPGLVLPKTTGLSWCCELAKSPLLILPHKHRRGSRFQQRLILLTNHKRNRLKGFLVSCLFFLLVNGKLLYTFLKCLVSD